MLERDIGDKIRQIRRRQAITLDVLTKRTGLSPGHLSKIERGLSSPSIATLSRIADALGASVSDFFENGDPHPRICVVPPDRRKPITRDSRLFGYHYESLAHRRPNKLMEPFVITVSPGNRTDHTFVHAGEELMYLLEGAVTLAYGDEHYTVDRVGTCVYFDAAVPHRADCLGSTEARLMVVIARWPGEGRPVEEDN